MSDQSDVSNEMMGAETRIRVALALDSPAERCDRLMDMYWATLPESRDAFVAVLVARLTLVSPRSPATQPGEAA